LNGHQPRYSLRQAVHCNNFGLTNTGVAITHHPYNIIHCKHFGSDLDKEKETKIDDEGGKKEQKKSMTEVTVNHEISEMDEDEDESISTPITEKERAEIDLSRHTHEVKINMPDMDGIGGKIVQWYKAEGDLIKRGDLLCDIETEVRIYVLGCYVFMQPPFL